MICFQNPSRTGVAVPSWLAIAFFIIPLLLCDHAIAQAPNGTSNNQPRFEFTPSQAQGVNPQEIAELQNAAKSSPPAEPQEPQYINVLDLIIKGGLVMIPLAIVSLFVVMWTLERLFSLRSGRVMPGGFVRSLTQLIRKSDTLPVQEAYRLCAQYPSVAANVVATTLIRTGRPLPEIDKAASEAIQREVDTATGPVRWLAFFASVAPLLGLLGTVLGLIQTFYATTQLAPNQNRIESLATGIYEALVTTMAGLLVAIPAMASAQFFENRVLRLFRRIEDLIALMLPRLEGYENRTRFDPIGNELVARDIQPIASRHESNNPRTSVRGTVVSPSDIDAAISEASAEVNASTRTRGSGTIRADRSTSRNG